MIYYTISAKATPGREAEAVRWIKKMAQYNEQNYARTVEVLHPMDGPGNVYIFVIKMESLTVWEADTKRWVEDAQGNAMLKEGDGLVSDLENHLYEVL